MKTLVDTMKAMVITDYGGTEVFKSQEMPISKPKEKELLVKVYATSVNPVIDSVMPFSEVKTAHEKLEKGGVRGKIVLQVIK